MSKAMEHLKKDPVMNKLIHKHGELALTVSENLFKDLVSSIIGQQLSAKAAYTILRRVLCLMNNDLTVGNILELPDESLRKAGVSKNKVMYINNLAKAIDNKSIILETLEYLTNDDIIKQLTKIKGIGVWTAEMFLLFSLARNDVFSLGDKGLNTSINKLYSENNALHKNEIIEITQKWIPYRSYASLYLWKELDS
jgi:DNA-3-methyladenine glycosylase II